MSWFLGVLEFVYGKGDRSNDRVFWAGVGLILLGAGMTYMFFSTAGMSVFLLFVLTPYVLGALWNQRNEKGDF